jgi:3-deoxy-D-manno-octulosonate 8-phosphate phosphatase KdsC-like HAD superfamily phosphatase
MQDPSSIERRAARIKLLLMDCDGVLTDGRLRELEEENRRLKQISADLLLENRAP